MLSKRQAEDLRARLAAGEKITLRARVAAKMVPASYDVVSVSDIRDVLTGRYEPVPVKEVAEYLELLGRAKVITWR